MTRVMSSRMRSVRWAAHWMIAIVLLAAFTAQAPARSDSSAVRNIRIALVADGRWDRNDEIFQELKTVLNEVLGNRVRLSFQGGGIIEGDWTLATMHRINDGMLADPEVDMILGLGVIASHDLATRGPLPKPVIAPAIIDPARQNIPLKNGASGVKNLSYLVFPTTLERDLETFRSIVPFTKLVLISSKPFHDVLPTPLKTMEALGKKTGISFIPLTIDSTADEVLRAIPPDAQAVYLDAVLNLPETEFQRLVQGLIDRRLPSFSLLGEGEVKRGIMAGANPDVVPRLIRRLALNVQRILQGEEPGGLSVTFPAARRLFFNFRTSYLVMATPDWDVLLQSDLVQVDNVSTFSDHYDLAAAMRRVAESNLDVQAMTRAVSASAENVAIARGTLLPRIDLGATGYQIDADRAQASLQPERSASAELGVSQVLFSEPALANVSIQSSLYDSKVDELEKNRLDMVTSGVAAYLNCLRMRQLFNITLENLKNTRSNLELAQTRKSNGVAGEEEVLRWQVEIAEMKKAVMSLHAQMNQVRYVLNQFLNLPINQQLDIAEVGLDDTSLIVSNPRISAYLRNPIAFDIMTEYLVTEGIKRSPELKQIDAAIEARERALTSTRISYFLPTVTAFAKLSNNFYRTDQPSLFQLGSIPPPPAGLDPRVPQYIGSLFSAASPALPDRNDWTVGLQFSLNLFNGFSTHAAEAQASEETEQYKLQQASLKEQLSMRIRSDLQSVKASYFAIGQSEAERNAAHRGLKLVTDAYSRGAVSILSVLDAQSASLRADQVAANALYDFFVQYMQFQRSLGQFDLLMTPDERTAWITNIIDRVEYSLRRN